MRTSDADPAGAKGAREIDVPQFIDPRGCLVAFEQARPLPFTPVRAFVIADVPPGAHRAQHEVPCDQFLWMVAGACRAIVRQTGASDVESERQFRLVARGPGLYLPQGAWLDLSDFADGSILLCLAASGYDARD